MRFSLKTAGEPKIDAASIDEVHQALDELVYAPGQSFVILSPDTLIDGSDFMQTAIMKKVSDSSLWFVVEISMQGDGERRYFQYSTQDKTEVYALFTAYYQGILPEYTCWEDITETVRREVPMEGYKVRLFKAVEAFKRENDDTIYRGFNLRHLLGAAEEGLQPGNDDPDNVLGPYQAVGEAVALFSELLAYLVKGEGEARGEVYLSEDEQIAFVELIPSADWHREGVIAGEIAKYQALINGGRVRLAAYDAEGGLLPGDAEDLAKLYKLLPCLAAVLALDMQADEGLRQTLLTYMDCPTMKGLADIHVALRDRHREEEYTLRYEDLSEYSLEGYTALSEHYSIIRENRAALQRVNGADHGMKCFDMNAFRAEYRRLIPRLSQEFLLPEELEGLCSAITSGDVRATLLHGPAGTGKTISCKLICQAIGMPIMDTVNCTENLDEFVLGKYIPEDDRIRFRESQVTKAIRHGGAVVFEEINFARPQYLAFLNSLLDDNGFVRLDSGEVVRRHPNFRFFATMNLGYFGTRELNQALYNRFNAIIEVAALSDDAIRRMLLARAGECEPMVDKLLGVYHKLKRKIEAEELDIVLSPRNLENWARLAKYEGYLKAADKTILPIARCDRAMEDTIRGILILYKWN